MTDKQIIIDGVDVRGCLHYAGNVNYLTDKNWTCRAGIQGTKCEDWSDCYFKSWQRKEQECEELKELVKKQKDVLIHKTILADEYEKAYLFENLKVAKLKYCLTEIKEIAESEMDSKEFMAVQCMLNGSIDNKNKVLEQILQKISECEGNDEN